MSSSPSRLPRGGVDRNNRDRRDRWLDCRRLPRGGVDRNNQEMISLGQQAVASRAEAWIETTTRAVHVPDARSPPARRRGSKPFHARLRMGVPIPSRLPRGGVDRNCHAGKNWCPPPGRLPRGGVDRNRDIALAVSGAVGGRLPRGGVDRNLRGLHTLLREGRRLPRGGVDRNWNPENTALAIRCRLPRGGVDRNYTG